MAFSQQEADELLRRLSAAQQDARCSKCTVNNWLIIGPIDFPISNERGMIMPSAALVCQGCGHIDWVNLMVVGLR